MFSSTLSRPSSHLRVWLAAGVLGLFSVCISAWQLWHSHRLYLETSERLLISLSNIAAQRIAGNLRNIDLLLQDTAKRVPTATDTLSSETIETWRDRLKSLPELRSMVIANANDTIKGFVLPYQSQLPTQLNIADTKYFRFQQAYWPQNQLFIANPGLDPLTQQPSVYLSRPLSSLNGQFGGMIAASADVNFIDQAVASVLPHELGSSAAVFNTDGIMLSRVPHPNKWRGVRPAQSELVKAALRSTGKDGVVTLVAKTDGTERISSFTWLPNYPLFVAVGLPMESVLAPWWREAKLHLAGQLIILIGIFTFSYLLSRAEKARHQSDIRLSQTQEQHIATLNSAVEEQTRALRTSMNTLRTQQAELEASRNLLTQIYDSLSDHLFLFQPETDGGFRLIATNKAMCRFFGIQAEQVIQKRVEDILGVLIQNTEVDVDSITHHYRRVYTTAQPAHYEEVALNTEGTAITFDTLLVPILDQSGRCIYICGVSRDISERKLMELTLQKMNETLEQRIHQAVSENVEKERLLIQQSRLAAMGEMIGNIAHQWRQPLNALSLLIANLKDAWEYDELDQNTLNEMTERGNRLIQKMSTTIDDFRNFFRPDKQKVAFSVSQLTQDTLSLLSASLQSHNIEVHFHGSSDIQASGYPNEFSQVLLNLLNNAKDALIERHVKEGEILITIDDSDAEFIELRIEDNAGGIAEDILPKIFDPYFTTKDKGTGIGLYMSKMIIENNMSGELTVYNTSRGACFVVRCPRLLAEI